MKAGKWPDFKIGDTIRVYQRVKEIAVSTKKVSKTAKKAIESKGGDKGTVERIQVFEGVVIAMKHGRGLDGTFTVRKIAVGIGVEKIFPMHTSHIEKIEIIKRAHVRRAKLYFVRALRGKKAKMKETELSNLIVEDEKEGASKEEVVAK